jgi:hypothetical protein
MSQAAPAALGANAPRPAAAGTGPGGGAQQQAGATAARVVDLAGDSPEVIAFALLRYLAQIEQQQAQTSGVRRQFDREWLLDAYAECLEAVRGERKV